jgi:hypothetical protein
MSKNTSEEGGCLCGAIRYRVSGPAISKTLCHCRSCRLACGGPTLAWAIFDVKDIEFISGALTEFCSSPQTLRGFCNACGTTLTYRTEKRPEHLDITTATFDHPQHFMPDCEIYVAEKIAWETLHPDLRRYERSSRKD